MNTNRTSAVRSTALGRTLLWLRDRPMQATIVVLAIMLVLICLFGPLLAPYDPTALGTGRRFEGLSLAHPMGTDNLGRDVFSRFLSGARISVGIGLLAAIMSTALGLLVGSLAGYCEGWVDETLMRVTELFMVIPRFFLALLMVALFGASLTNIILAIALLTWPVTARLVRAEFIALRDRQFVQRAKMAGSSHLYIMVREILPNCMGVVIVSGTLLCAEAMLLEAGLSYFGLGDPSSGSWGLMLYEAQSYLRNAWWLSAFPGLGIFLAVLIFNILGDGLNEAYNPRSGDTSRVNA
jgi:peptide/nickel transport system permease protein